MYICGNTSVPVAGRREGGREEGRKSVASMIDHQGGREEAREEGSVHECMGGMIVHVGSTSVHIHVYMYIVGTHQ